MSKSSNYDFSDVLPEASSQSRLRAFLADILLIGALFTIFHIYLNHEVFSTVSLVFFGVLIWLYFSLFQFLFFYTPGLFMMRLRLVSTSSDHHVLLSQVFKRNLFFFTSAGISGFSIPFSKNNCGIHDSIFKTKIVFKDPMGEPAGYWRIKILMLLAFQLSYGGLSYYWMLRTPVLAWKIEEALHDQGANFLNFEGDWSSGFVLTGLTLNSTTKINKIRIHLESPLNMLLTRSLIVKTLEVSEIDTATEFTSEDLIKYLSNPQVFTEIAKQVKINVFRTVMINNLEVNSDKFKFTLKDTSLKNNEFSWQKFNYSSNVLMLSTGPVEISDSQVEMKNSISIKLLGLKETKIKQPIDLQFHLSIINNQINTYYVSGFLGKFKLTKQQLHPYQLFIFSLNPSEFFETGFPGENLSVFSKSPNLLNLFIAAPSSGFFTVGDSKFNFDPSSGEAITATHRRGNDEYRISFPQNFLLSAFDPISSAILSTSKKERLEAILSKIEFNEGPQSLNEAQIQKLNLTLRYFGVTPRTPANN